MDKSSTSRDFLNDLLAKQRLKEQAEAICKEYGLNMSMFIQLYTFWTAGYSGLEAAQTLGVSMTTVRCYDKTIRNMTESKVQILIDCNDVVTKCAQNRKSGRNN